MEEDKTLSRNEKIQISISKPNGQWSEPITSDKIKESITFSLNSLLTKK